MLLFLLILGFIGVEKMDYLKTAIEGNDKKEFIKAIKELEKINPEDLEDDFKRYLCQRAIEIFDLSLIQKSWGYVNNVKFYFKDEKVRKELYDYQKAVFSLLNYISIFSEKHFVEEIFKRSITKNLIIYHTKDTISLIKKNEKEFKSPLKVSNVVGNILKLREKGKIFLKEEDITYLKNLFFKRYNNSNQKQKCDMFSGNIFVFKENFINDEEIIGEAKKCICKKRSFYSVILLEIELIENKVKGVDMLIRDFIEKEKESKKKEIQKELLNLYLKGGEVNFPEFYEKFNLKELEYLPNEYCKKFLFF